MYIQEQEERDFYIPSEAEWDRAAASELGSARPDLAWICTDRDVWYPNPFYSGPPVAHPEDDYLYFGGDDRTPEEVEEDRRARLEDAASDIEAYAFDDDIPF
jgi:hypothetical protein